jgi:DNA-binding transcriptional LysR family regulator
VQLQQLQTFYEVATSGSFTRAAAKLYLSQPAVTQQVRALESELGFPLIERQGRRLRLTPAGEALLAYPPQLVALVEEAVNAAREAAGRGTQTLHLGAGDTVATYILPDLIRDFHATRPQAALRLVVGNTERLLEAILHNEVELAIWARQDSHPLLHERPFAWAPLVAVLQPSDPLAEQPRIWARELVGRRLLLRGRASAIRRFIDDLLRRADVDTSDAIEMDHLEAIKRTVEIGYGVTVAPAFAVSREVALGTLAAVPLADDGAELPLYFAHYTHRRLSPLAQAAIELVRATPAVAALRLAGLPSGSDLQSKAESTSQEPESRTRTDESRRSFELPDD